MSQHEPPASHTDHSLPYCLSSLTRDVRACVRTHTRTHTRTLETPMDSTASPCPTVTPLSTPWAGSSEAVCSPARSSPGRRRPRGSEKERAPKTSPRTKTPPTRGETAYFLFITRKHSPTQPCKPTRT